MTCRWKERWTKMILSLVIDRKIKEGKAVRLLDCVLFRKYASKLEDFLEP